MSLFDQPSTILRLIMEAEQFKVSPDQEMAMPEGDGAGVSDVATELTSATPPPTADPNGAMQIGNIPQPSSNMATTLNKTVVNTEVLLSQLSELKSLINNYEKKFEGDDISVDSSKILVGSLLNSLIYHAEKLQAFLGLPDSTSVAPAPTTPATQPTPVEPELPTKPNLGAV